MEKFLIAIFCNAVSLLCIAGSIIIIIINSKEKKMEKRTKKDEYNESLIDKRTYINVNNNELDMKKELDRDSKAYYYLRNGVLHVRYRTVKFVELSETELSSLRERLGKTNDRQKEMKAEWNFQTGNLGKEVKDV